MLLVRGTRARAYVCVYVFVSGLMLEKLYLKEKQGKNPMECSKIMYSEF